MFKNKVLIEADVVDRSGDLIPREVLEKAVAAAQEQMKAGTPLLITKRFSGKLRDTQGLVTNIRMEGSKAVIDGAILDTDPGRAVQELMEDKKDVEYAMAGVGTPELDSETGVRTYQDVSISSVTAVPADEKVK